MGSGEHMHACMYGKVTGGPALRACVGWMSPVRRRGQPGGWGMWQPRGTAGRQESVPWLRPAASGHRHNSKVVTERAEAYLAGS